MGKELVGKCKRLPLAIIILGGLLLLKSKNVLVWDNVLKTLDWRDRCEVLALSYHDMPSYLKPCFLYLGLFPEDAVIRSNKLKMLWIAEGFTELYKHDKMTAEEIAEFYLEELYQRSMIQVVSKKSYGGFRTCGIKSFRIHDLLKDLAIAEGIEFNFLTIHRGTLLLPTESNSSPKAPRRLAIQSPLQHNQTQFDSPKLRSLLCFYVGQEYQFRNLLPIVDRLKLLRVIDLNNVTLEQLPKQIGTLIFLRFLGLNNTGLKRLPESVGDLFNLLTLDVRTDGELRKLKVPPSVWKLKKLRHLYVDQYIAPQLIELPNIQILNGIPAGDWIANCLGTGLIPRKLPLKDLNRLFLLALVGRLERLPDVTGFPTQLMKLTLCASKLDQDPMPVLGQLQSLESLKLLKDSYTGDQMFCPPSSFPKLKFFMLREIPLSEWELEDRAMISLKRLFIYGCNNLTMLPEGLKHTDDFQELELVDMPSQFLNRVDENGGEDFHKIHRSILIIKVVAEEDS
ncbi:Disease resistance protein RPP8 [Acorus gramineus]|uniref:Disease resistance protein RPP8 n=1 Tax=Acorus gramineus TaxID=55184 RepID=A0AAV9AZ74_ACOGR|nr:Disease resistance protein RPP8 [Acorus gramineus]